jgi:Zn-dependent protease with chaperone function
MIPGLALVLAVSPGLLAWLLGRRLIGHGSEETLPERLLALRQRVGQASGVAASVLLLLAGPHNAWALPVLVLTLLAGSFPARRAVLEESWGLPAYVSHMLRFGLGGAGFFALLAATPALVYGLGGPTTLILILVLAFWATGSTQIFLFLARATPLDRPDLVPHLDRVVAASGHRGPRLYRAGPRGGRFVNAFAFPAAKESSVLFTDDLLAHFTPEETAAVFAHEMAHLEHYDVKKLRRRGLAMVLLMALALFVMPAAALGLPHFAHWILGAWALGIALGVPMSLAAHRSHEAESDLRAVALCGDAEALVRALVKLTTLARMPRRWALDVEQHSSHPSLARRIQAIRKAAGTSPPSLSAPVVLAGRETGRFVVLENDRAHWLEAAPEASAGDPAALRLGAGRVRSHAYGDLAELHVDVSMGHASLRAVTTSGEKWTVPLRPEAVAAAQTALDHLDEHLAAHEPKPAFLPILMILAAGLLGVFGLAAGHSLLVAPISLVALLRPGPAPLGAAGATALAAALVSLVRPSVWLPRSAWLVVGLAGAGLVGLLAAGLLWKRSPSARRQGALTALIVQSVVAAASAAGLAWAATLAQPVLRLHSAAGGPAPVASLSGLAALLLFAPWKRARVAAIAAALAAAALVAFLGSAAFARLAIDDPFLVDSAPLAEVPLRLTLVQEERVARPGGELRVSPSGRSFALLVWDDEDEESPSRFRVGSFGGPTRDLVADELRFVDDEQALIVVDGGEDATELRLVSLNQPEAEPWRVRLPWLLSSHLEVDPQARSWRLTGRAPKKPEALVLAGHLGRAEWSELRLSMPEGASHILALGARGGLALRFDVDTERLQRIPWPIFMLGTTYTMETEVSRLTTEGPRPLARTGLRVQCPPPALDEAFFCIADDGHRSTVFQADPGTGRLEERGSFLGQAVPWRVARGGRLYLWGATRGAMVVETATRTLRPVAVAGMGAIALSGDGSVLVAMRTEGASGVVTAYRAE